jgi:peptidyl-prolyl cis-trans isomerase D
MLETIRNNSRSFLIYLIFGILILVFIISFGPQSGQGGGCGGSARAAAEIAGQSVSETSWRYGILAMTGGSASGERARRALVRERVLDRLFVRELLAREAESMGFRISNDEVREKILKGDIYVLGDRVDGKRAYYVKEAGDDVPRFKARALDLFAKNVGLGSVDRFIEEEKRELLAQKVLDLVNAGVRVSPEEVQHQYALDSTKVEIEYVTFPMMTHRDTIEPTAADVDAYLAEHEAALQADFEKEADRWKGRDKEVRLRHLFVKADGPDAADAAPPAPARPPSRRGAAPKPETARAKIDAAAAKIKAGQEFSAVVKATNPDARRGGDLGWRPLRGLRLGAPVAEAVERLDKGQTSDVIETPEGFHIVQLLDMREGDVSFDQVKRELAEEALLDARAKGEAMAQAEKALAAARAGTPLDKQFPSEGGDAPAPGAAPRLQKASDVGRVGGYIPGIGTLPDLTTELFDSLEEGALASRVYELSGDAFVVRLVKRTEPDMAKFQQERAKLADSLRERKAFDAVTEYQSRRCQEARDRGKIQYDPGLVLYNDVDAKLQTPYVPCMTLR